MKSHDKIGDPVYLSPQEDPRLTIYKEIETYRSKLSQYQQLQKELNQLNLHLNASQAPSNDTNKLAKMKSQRGKVVGSATKRNSHKKIKIYELHKKYDKVARENEEKHSVFDKNMESHNKFLWGIQDLGSKIENQKKTSENLKQLSLQIEGDLQAISIKIEKEVQSLEESVKTKQSCNYERKKIREDIKRTRMQIHNITNNLTEDLQLSYSDQDERINHKNDVSLSPAEGSPREQMPPATDIQIWMEKQNKRIETSLNRYESKHEKNENYLHDFYNLKKEMISNELLVKHHKVTIALQTSQIKEYGSLVEGYRQNIAKRSQITNNLASKINRLDGERGFMRGRIGVKIQQQRLVRAVNVLMEEDIKRVRDKLGYLIFLKKLVQNRTS